MQIARYTLKCWILTIKSFPRNYWLWLLIAFISWTLITRGVLRAVLLLGLAMIGVPVAAWRKDLLDKYRKKP